MKCFTEVRANAVIRKLLKHNWVIWGDVPPVIQNEIRCGLNQYVSAKGMFPADDTPVLITKRGYKLFERMNK